MRAGHLALAVAPFVLTAACNDLVGNKDKALLVRSNRVDLVIAVDATTGMGPKHTAFANALQQMLARLAAPNCVGAGAPSPSSNGKCASGTLEFAPVDLHVAVVSSSLGPRGSPSCTKGHGDDRGLPLARGVSAEPFGFLTLAPGEDPAPLFTATTALFANIGEDGCQFPAQHESWYRFLVQPDPYATVNATSDFISFHSGVDEKVLEARRQFLRSDSVVAVIVLSGRDDQSLDPRSDGGLGWLSLDTTTAPFRPSSSCSVAPEGSSCAACPLATDDIDCSAKGSHLTKAEDPPNLRLVTMKQRFGEDRLFPVERYVRGLTSETVPDSAAEHQKLASSEFWKRYGEDATASCTSPLFAATLPGSASQDLCHLPRGPRRTDQIFYAAIGGIPADLLGDGRLTDAFFAHALGRALSYDKTGVDPRMLESTSPRPGAPDDRDTKGSDLEYPCTFDQPFADRAVAVYPMLRQLAVAKGVGDSKAAVGTICAATDDDPTTVYVAPLMRLVDRMAHALAK